MVRTRAFDPAAALLRAVELFASKGYSDTSIEDLVQATGVSRYGLYGTFGNKRELFERALERYADRMGRQSFLRLLEPDAGLGDIRAVFEERIEAMGGADRRQGCMFLHTATALAPHEPEIAEVMQKFVRRMSKALAAGVASAREKGEVRADLDVRAAGDFLTGALFGLGLLAQAGCPRQVLENFVESTMASLAP